jgi:hypothetical protein
MAMTATTTVADDLYRRHPTLPRPRWPTAPIDPTVVSVSYDAPADELILYFGGRPVPSFTDQIDAPDGDVHLLVNEETGDVVGIHVYPFLAGAVQWRPAWARVVWAVLAGEYGTIELLQELPGFIAEVADLAARYGIDGPIEGLDRPTDAAP